MRVLAASFPDQASARSARDHLISTFTLKESEIGVKPLAVGNPRKHAAILAGRFEEDVVFAAIDVAAHFGGTLVIDIDDLGRNA